MSLYWICEGGKLTRPMLIYGKYFPVQLPAIGACFTSTHWICNHASENGEEQTSSAAGTTVPSRLPGDRIGYQRRLYRLII